MSVDRRTVLKTSAAIAAAGPFAGLLAAPAEARTATEDRRAGAGARRARRQGPAVAARRASSTGRSTTRRQPVTLTDGTALPGRHDGMGAFKGPGGTVLLVRNHEVNNPRARVRPGRRRTTRWPAVARPPSR